MLGLLAGYRVRLVHTTAEREHPEDTELARPLGLVPLVCRPRADVLPAGSPNPLHMHQHMADDQEATHVCRGPEAQAAGGTQKSEKQVYADYLATVEEEYKSTYKSDPHEHSVD